MCEYFSILFLVITLINVQRSFIFNNFASTVLGLIEIFSSVICVYHAILQALLTADKNSMGTLFPKQF
jgi:tryptophan-rich sensory protein